MIWKKTNQIFYIDCYDPDPKFRPSEDLHRRVLGSIWRKTRIINGVKYRRHYLTSNPKLCNEPPIPPLAAGLAGQKVSAPGPKPNGKRNVPPGFKSWAEFHWDHWRRNRGYCKDNLAAEKGVRFAFMLTLAAIVYVL